MNNHKLIKITQTLLNKAGPQLRSFAYANWVGWLIILLSLLLCMAILWKLRYKITIGNDIDPAPLGHVLFWIATTLFVGTIIAFIPWTLQVFMSPELSGLQLLMPS